MKKIGLVLWALFFVGCTTLVGKPADPALLTMGVVFEVANTSQNQLYVKANTWAVKTFTKADSTIEFSDKESGTISGKFVTEYFDGMYSSMIKSTFQVNVKDGKSKISFSDPSYRITGNLLAAMNGQSGAQYSYSPLVNDVPIKDLRIEWIAIAKSLEQALNAQDEAW